MSRCSNSCASMTWRCASSLFSCRNAASRARAACNSAAAMRSFSSSDGLLSNANVSAVNGCSNSCCTSMI